MEKRLGLCNEVLNALLESSEGRGSERCVALQRNRHHACCIGIQIRVGMWRDVWNPSLHWRRIASGMTIIIMA